MSCRRVCTQSSHEDLLDVPPVPVERPQVKIPAFRAPPPFLYLVIKTIGRSRNKYVREIAYFLAPELLPESRAKFRECRDEARSGDPDKADKMCDLGFRYAHGKGCP